MLPLLILSLGALVVYCGVLLARVFAAYHRVQVMPTTRLRDLQEGLVEVSGTLRCEEPIVAPSGKECAAIMVRIRPISQGHAQGRKTLHPAVERVFMAECWLEDSNGDKIWLSKEGCINVAGECYLADEIPASSVPLDWLPTLKTGSLQGNLPVALRVEEYRIEVGSSVLVHAHASPAEVTDDEAGEAPCHFLLEPPDEGVMLVMRGSQREVLRQGEKALLGMTLALAYLLLLLAALVKA